MLSLDLLFCYTLIILIVLQNLTVAYPRQIFQYNPKEAGAFEGDIILPSSTRGVGEAAQEARWTNGIVPYVIKPGDFNAEQEAVIVKSMRRLEQLVAINNKLCIQFRPKISTDKHFTTIKTGAGCTSTVGQNWYSSKELNLGNGCVHEGTILHELLHTLGFWHEQSRPDRDNYVTIQYENVQPGLEHAFNKYTTSVDTLGTPYDYKSVMHYGIYDFSYNGKPTIVPKNSAAQIGTGPAVLSPIDILEVQLYYQCTGSVSERKCDKFIRKDNWDIPYNDILSSPVQVADYASCCAKCQATPGCNAFAYAPSTKHCWPKTSTGDNGYGYSHSDRIIGYMPRRSTLSAGQQLKQGEALISPSGNYRLVMQEDGNLVIYVSQKIVIANAIWATNNLSNGPHRLQVQTDGNLATYDGSNRPTWASNTVRKNVERGHLAMQDDGNAVFYDNNHQPVWASNSCCYIKARE